MRTKGRRRLTCHHEAGHALVRWYFGHRTDRAVVLAVEEVRAGVRVENRRGNFVECEGMIDAYDICGWPYGPFGINGTVDAQAEYDHRRSVERDIELIECHAGFLAEAHYRHTSPNDAMFTGGLPDMDRAMTILDAWSLTGDARRDEARKAGDRASALVRSRLGSAAIKAMADALMEYGDIDGDEIGRLCTIAYGGRACAFGAWSECWPPTLAQIRAGFIPDPPPPQERAA